MTQPYPWLTLAQKLQSIAQAGLTFTTNKYDVERFEQIMDAAAEIVAHHSELNKSEVASIFSKEDGYLTPKVDVRGVVLRGNTILLVRETIDGKWALPGGWADVGFTASEVVVKEVQEESGLEVKAERLLAVLDKKCHPHPPDLHYAYKFFFLCHETGGALSPGMETSDAAFFTLDKLPELSTERNTSSQIETMLRLASGNYPVLFD